MKLENIIKNCGTVTTKGDLTMEVNGLTSDSRKVVPGTMFIAVKGFAGDGHKFIASALAKGAAAIMYETRKSLRLRSMLPDRKVLSMLTERHSCRWRIHVTQKRWLLLISTAIRLTN